MKFTLDVPAGVTRAHLGQLNVTALHVRAEDGSEAVFYLAAMAVQEEAGEMHTLIELAFPPSTTAAYLVESDPEGRATMVRDVTVQRNARNN